MGDVLFNDMAPSHSPSFLWQQQARRTVRRVNLAWWLQLFAPWMAGIGLASMAGGLLWRSHGGNLQPGMGAAGVLVLNGLAAWGCWFVGRRRFYQEQDGLVRLESTLKLNNALSAAAAGVTAWPVVPVQVDDGFRFRAPWLVAPVLLGVIGPLLAFLLPVSQAPAPPSLPPPLALSRAAELLQALEKEQVADPVALAKAREQWEALMAQPPEDYYSHHSLEAADNLETSLQEAAGQLGSQLQTAVQAAESLEKYDTSLSPTAREQLENEMGKAVEGIKNASMGASESLKKQLGKLDPSKLKELNPDQVKKMLENLKAKSAACKICQGKGQGQGKSEAEQALADLLNGKDGNSNSKGKSPGKEGEGMGRGGVDRGPGTGDLTFEKDASDLASNKLEQLESGDLSRSLPGDHLGTKDMEHRLDKTTSTPVDGGSAAAPATGGEAVQRDQLMPAEQKILRRYFK